MVTLIEGPRDVNTLLQERKGCLLACQFSASSARKSLKRSKVRHSARRGAHPSPTIMPPNIRKSPHLSAISAWLHLRYLSPFREALTAKLGGEINYISPNLTSHSNVRWPNENGLSISRDSSRSGLFCGNPWLRIWAQRICRAIAAPRSRQRKKRGTYTGNSFRAQRASGRQNGYLAIAIRLTSRIALSRDSKADHSTTRPPTKRVNSTTGFAFGP